ncbi:glycoside hydrolase domain-containing protein [Nocardioides jishulii]|uniref:DUF1906 domain-containing protein n=1 Tax=Nocardioides jishulii TaxID=2575440 RepID=A0A4U2YT41_9ACTN|nr:glycoside hydrolase domain-containing protein [Nocardioides jishulii]QCX26393.1 DUF1906 domain-containing protein [Nocardioides jishulii]TKI63802.1 DUF1906 domain-containing protein [Nocardioides jishulii]
MPSNQPAARAFVRRLTAAAGTLALSAALLTTTAPAASSAPAVATVAKKTTNPVTPGNFKGYGFDQCLAPTQQKMDAWLNHSPYLAVGIYISGDSRACRSQPNLTPRWVSTQLSKGWRLLPIALGPQASCQERFPRYKDDFTINPTPGKGGRYPKARTQGAREAEKNAADAEALGLRHGSTLWYDLEGFTLTNKHCRESALAFVSAWVNRIHQLGYVSGMYSGASSGIKMVDDARVERPGKFKLPKNIWIARWDGKANTSTDYIRNDGWRPGGRMKQYLGGHDERYGNVTINIDTNFLDLGKGNHPGTERRCNGIRTSFTSYPAIKPGTTYKGRVQALQCALKEQGHYPWRMHGKYNKRTQKAVAAWQRAHGLRTSTTFSQSHWVRLHSHGARPVLKVGSASNAVRRLQRALVAAGVSKDVATGVYDQKTKKAVKAYQKRRKMTRNGNAHPVVWRYLASGVR